MGNKTKFKRAGTAINSKVLLFVKRPEKKTREKNRDPIKLA